MSGFGDHDQPPQQGAPTPAADRAHRSTAWWALEWIVVVAVALILALGVRMYVVQTFFIPSGSMEPTLQIGDRILVFKLAYDFTSPAAGDVVVFHAPPAEANHCEDPGVKDLVKRIVGLPNQWISSSGNQILIKKNTKGATWHMLRQTWTHFPELGSPITTQLIQPNHYFMVGDNHPDSCDSRVWGQLPGSDIIGKVVLKIWPLSQFGTV